MHIIYNKTKQMECVESKKKSKANKMRELMEK